MTTISSGHSATSTAVTAADSLTVENGGIATTPTVSSGGFAVISGSALSATVLSGGSFQVANGGVAAATTLSSGGSEVVSSGGIASGTQILSGGLLVLSSGGVGGRTTLSANGQEVISSGGAESGGTITDGLMTVSSGGSALNITLQSGTGLTQLNVESGGTVSGAILADTAVAFISGSATGTIVDDGGFLRISSDGIASNTIISGPATVISGATSGPGHQQGLIVSSGGSACDTTVYHEIMVISSGGNASGVTLNDAAIIVHGTVYELTANPQYNGYNVRIDDGIASGVHTSNTVRVLVYDNGVIYNDIIESGGTEAVVGDGMAATSYNAEVKSGGFLSGYNITSNGDVSVVSATVDKGGLLKITTSAIASNTFVTGSMSVDSNGSATDTRVLSGGLLTIGDPSFSENAIVSSGGEMILSSGGVGSNTLIESAGQETVSSGSLESGGVVSGGLLTISSGGTGSSITLSNGSSVIVSGGLESAVTVTGGILTVQEGGSAATVSIASNGSAVVSGAVSDTTVSGGRLTVDGATASLTNLTLTGGGRLELTDGATAADLTWGNAGVTVSSGSMITSATVQSAGTLLVTENASAVSSLLESGAASELAGQAFATTIGSGAYLNVTSGGIASDTVVSSGGMETVGSGSLESGGTVLSFGLIDITSGGVASALVLNSGAETTYYNTSGYTPDGSTVVDMHNGVTASGPLAVTVESGGVLNGATVGDASIIVSSGGRASNVVMLSGSVGGPAYSLGAYGTITVSAGGYLSDVVVGNYDSLNEQGTETNVTIGGVGTLNDSAGSSGARTPLATEVVEGATALIQNDTVSSGGVLYLGDGSATDTLIVDGGTFMLAGGAASGLTVITSDSNAALNSLDDARAIFLGGVTSEVTAHYGTLRISGNAQVFDIAVDSKSDLLVAKNGWAESGSASGNTSLTIVGGGTVTGFTIEDGSTTTVSSGGALMRTSVGTNAVTMVTSSGATVSVTLASGGSEVLSGGMASATVVSSGGDLDVASGGIDSGATLLGGTETVSSGGLASAVTVSEGQLTVQAGGTVSGASILSGGSAIVSGALADGMVSGGTLILDGADASLNRLGLVDGGQLELANGATTTSLMWSDADVTIDSGSTSISATVSSGGALKVSSGGAGSNTQVSAGGKEIVSAGGIESGGTVHGDLLLSGAGALGQQISLGDGGTLEITTDAIASGVINSNGSITVENGSEIQNINAQSGAVTVTGTSSMLSGASLSGNASLRLADGALGQDLILTSGTVTSVTENAVLTSARLSSNTITTVISSGSAHDLTVSGGQVLISGGGLLITATVTDSGDVHIYGGQVSSVTLSNGTLEIDADGYAVNTEVLSGGLLAVGDPSISESAVVSSGGVMTVSSGGIGSNTLVESGGQETVFSGSLESGGTVSGGLLTVNSGGSAVSVTLATDTASPSTLVVASGGTASSTLIADQSIAFVSGSTISDRISGPNAQEIVSSGGSASYTIIEGGGTLTVLDNAQVSTVTVDNGTLSLSGAHASAHAVTLASTGHAVLADDAILSGSTYNAGTITVQSGGTLESATLTGTALATANMGGTVSAVTLLSGTRLTVSSGSIGLGTTVSSGAVLRAEANATVDDTTISSGALLQISTAATSHDTDLTSGGSIELLDTSWSDTDTISFSNNILTIDDNGTQITINLSAADDVYLTRDFVLSQADTDPLYANSNDILITLSPVACFCRGTLIETEFGPMLIENIMEGTRILTPDGGMTALQWKAVRRYTPRQIILGAGLRPLLIKAHALGDSLPRRDLRVSQLHMLYIDDVFIPAAALINDRTIFIEQNGTAVDYYHLDIGPQNIIFAEGVTTESLTDDDGSRRGFDNYDQHVAALPSSADVLMTAPLIREGEIITTLQERYARRAAILGVPFRQEREDSLLLF